MESYQEITLIFSPEIPYHFLWEKLFHQLHLAFVKSKDPEGKITIGISFPEYKKESGAHQLGTKLRLFAENESVLREFNVTQRLERLLDYIHVTSIGSVPDKALKYACYKRKQVHSNNDRLARRKAKRQGIGLAEAQNYFATRKEDHTDLPFIYLDSHTNKQRFRLLIERVPMEQEVKFGFGSYGLSAVSTVPEF